MRREVAHKGLADVEVEERFAYSTDRHQDAAKKTPICRESENDRQGTIGANLVVQADLEPKHLTT